MSCTIKQPQHVEGLAGEATSQSNDVNLEMIIASFFAPYALTAATFCVALCNYFYKGYLARQGEK